MFAQPRGLKPKPDTTKGILPILMKKAYIFYLTAAFILTGSLMFLRFATIGAEDSVAIMYNEMAPTLAFIIIAALVNGGTLFFYKKKTLQMRLSNISGITNIILQGYLLYHLFKLRELCESASYAHEAVSFSLTMVFPAIAAILDFLASRAISRQEAAGQLRIRLKKS